MNAELRQKAGLWLAAVFVLGAAIGGVFGYSFARHKVLAGPLPTKQLPEPARRAKRVAEMTKELGLTAEQAKAFDAIIHQTHDQMQVIRDHSEQEVDAERQKARNELRQLLTAEQKPKFEDMVQRMDAERKKVQQK